MLDAEMGSLRKQDAEIYIKSHFVTQPKKFSGNNKYNTRCMTHIQQYSY